MLKYLIFFLITSLLIFSSCEKSSPPSKENDANRFQITLSAFTVDISELSLVGSLGAGSTESLLSEHVQYLNYYVFNPSTKKTIKHITQDSTSSDFGVIRDSLVAGEYVFTVIGSTEPIDTLESLPCSSCIHFPIPGYDAFATNFKLIVGGPINQAVVLKRIMGKLKIVIEDKIPLEADFLEVGVFGLSNFYSLSNGKNVLSYEEERLRVELKESDKGKNSFEVETYVLGMLYSNMDAHDVILSYKDEEDNILGEVKVIFDVMIEPNKITTVRGNMGFGSGQEGLEVQIENSAWEYQSETYYF